MYNIYTPAFPLDSHLMFTTNGMGLGSNFGNSSQKNGGRGYVCKFIKYRTLKKISHLVSQEMIEEPLSESEVIPPRSTSRLVNRPSVEARLVDGPSSDPMEEGGLSDGPTKGEDSMDAEMKSVEDQVEHLFFFMI